MCLMVDLGTDVEVPGFDVATDGDVGLDPDCRRPTALGRKAHVSRVADRVPTGWNCSCVFLDGVAPGEDPDHADDDGAEVRRAAWAGLRRIAEAALILDPEALLFSCWDGDEGLPPTVERHLAPDDLKADRFLFDVPRDDGPGDNPPILIRLGSGGRGARPTRRWGR